jgi:alkylated DNA repair dioxygenase AlkB
MESRTPTPPQPQGIKFQPDFITPSHEAVLLRIFRHELVWPESKKPGTRLSLHYGYTFDYKTFGVDPDIPYKPFPDWLVPLIPEIKEGEKEEEEGGRRWPDQVCLQYYPPGAGIPPHVDTHSAYDQLYALSLGSGVVMQFRRQGEGEGERETVDIDLPPRSMMQMSGDSRLHWEHGIKKRKKDVLPDGTVRMRAERWSITYRWLREGGECECGDVRLCDTAQRRAGVEREYRWKLNELKKEEEQEVQEDNGESESKEEQKVSGDRTELDRHENGNISSPTYIYIR